MENFDLNKNGNTKEFKLNSSDSFIRIVHVSLILNKDSKISWTQLISKLSLNVELKYVVYIDEEGRFVDDRKIVIPIYLPFDTNHVYPIFDLNQVIKNETFTIGFNPEKKFFTDLKFELTENSIIDENYSLHFTVELFEIDNKSSDSLI